MKSKEQKPRLVRAKKYLYHVTCIKVWPSEITLFPRTPFCVDEDEPNIKRICTSETVSGCFSAINVDTDCRYVYRTKKPVEHYQPFGVTDSNITKEKWLLRKIKFIKVLEIPMNVVKKIPSNAIRGGRGHDLVEQKKEAKEIKNIIKKEFGHLGFK